MTPATAPRLPLFGEPLLLEGEDAAAYDKLRAGICEAAKPVDVIDEMFVADVVSLEWEVLRWRRLKLNLIRARGLKALQDFLNENLDDDLCTEHFADRLAESLAAYLPDDQPESAQTLARAYARNDPDGVDNINKVLAGNDLDLDKVCNRARADKAEELMQAYLRREPDAVALVQEVLADASLSMDALLADVLVEKLDEIERVDHLTTIAESRRNASLREIDRRRAVLGEMLRRRVQEVEDAEFKVIETTPAKGKKPLDERPQDQGQPRECAGQHRPENRAGPRSRGAKRISPRFEPARLPRSSFVRRGRNARARSCRDRGQR
jgi:hypothetical protein